MERLHKLFPPDGKISVTTGTLHAGPNSIAVAQTASLCRFGWYFWRRWTGRQSISLGSSFKPDLGQPHVGRANFRRVRFARPSEALFGHCLILGGRLHDKRPFIQMNSAINFADPVYILRDIEELSTAI
jgi:hypothetical protein